MGIEEVIERSEIKFQGDLDLHEMETLLKYIVKMLPGDIRYTLKLHKFVHTGMVQEAYREIVQVDLRSVNISGNITSYSTHEYQSFECENSDDGRLVTSMKFLPIPGYSLSEHRKESVELWDNVRHLVEEYFKERKNKVS